MPRWTYLVVGIIVVGLICWGWNISYFAGLILAGIGVVVGHYVDQHTAPTPTKDAEPEPNAEERIPYGCRIGYHIFGMPDQNGWQKCIRCPASQPAPIAPPPPPPPVPPLPPLKACPMHKWEDKDELDLDDEVGDIIGKVYVLQCENCGDLKSHRVYTDDSYSG